MKDRDEIVSLVRSRVPIILLETREETRAVDLLVLVARETRRPLFKWSVTEGLQRLEKGYLPQRHNRRPEDLLGHIKSAAQPGIFLLLDFHPYLEDPRVIRLIKDVSQQADRTGQTLVLLSRSLNLPPELHSFTARFRLALPGPECLRRVVEEEAGRWSRENNRRVQASTDTLRLLVRNLTGLSILEARQLVRRIIWDDGALTNEDLDRALQGKCTLLNRSGILFFEPDTRKFADVGGLDRMKKWLSKRRPAFSGEKPALDLPVPKGLLLVGIQGCGKSLAAKMVAGAWRLPLLRLDFGTVYNKYIGETERNLREALTTAEGLGPCVLWLDEIEKGVATGEQDGGTSRRVLGTLLTWMSERTAPVFTVATANQIDRLPPELIRKGRFDEIFFVDLPDHDARETIFRIHLKKRRLDPETFDLKTLADHSEGFSGAEIEQVVVAAIYSAKGKKGIDTGVLLEEIEMTRPLSVIMSEKVAELRDWAEKRTVSAG